MASSPNDSKSTRFGKAAAWAGPATGLEAFSLFQRIMREVGETLELSRDPEIISAVKRAQGAINRGEVIWDDEV